MPRSVLQERKANRVAVRLRVDPGPAATAPVARTDLEEGQVDLEDLEVKPGQVPRPGTEAPRVLGHILGRSAAGGTISLSSKVLVLAGNSKEGWTRSLTRTNRLS